MNMPSNLPDETSPTHLAEPDTVEAKREGNLLAGSPIDVQRTVIRNREPSGENSAKAAQETDRTAIYLRGPTAYCA